MGLLLMLRITHTHVHITAYTHMSVQIGMGIYMKEDGLRESDGETSGASSATRGSWTEFTPKDRVVSRFIEPAANVCLSSSL